MASSTKRVIAPANADPESRRLKGSKVPIHRLLQSNSLALALRLRLDAVWVWGDQRYARLGVCGTSTVVIHFRKTFSIILDQADA
jgi:hypothetical protein